MPILNDLQRVFNKVNPEVWYAAVAFLFAYMIWVSPSDDVLGKAVMVAVIIALTMYHLIAGILAVIAVIALMQTTNQREGFNQLLPTPPPITFASAAEFREKYCMKGVAQTGATEISTEYMLSPALFNDNNGKPQLKLEVIKQMNVPSLNASNSCKSTPPNSTNPNDYVTLSNMCDPVCNWTTNATSTAATTSATTAASTTPTMTTVTTAPRTVSSEGFTPMLRPHIRNAKHAVSDGMNTVKSGASRLKRQMF